MKSIPPLSLEQLYPPACDGVNLNTCHDPDCGNHGVDAEFSAARILGPNAKARLEKTRSNSGAVGLGKYHLDSNNQERRISTAFEYTGDPHTWKDRRKLECQFDGGSGPCGAHFELWSNEHVVEEIERLRSQNGIFTGPVCGACGRAYLDAPEEFVLDGAEIHRPRREGRPTARQAAAGAGKGATPDRVRLIHKPCKGRKGARVSATLDHRRQRNSSDNVKILMELVNGTGITKIVRKLSPAGSGRTCGVKRVYDRIFWLEKTLLAFERAQLARWKAEREASGEEIRHHLAHDDIVLSVNWETSEDRRLTHLNCSATADVRSGYVFRIDVDFDPTIDPISMVEESYLDPNGTPKNLRKSYRRSSGLRFTAPLMEHQRPTGRLDEHQLFAAARHRLSLFKEEVIERTPGATQAQQTQKAATLADLDDRLAFIEDVHEGYFDLPPSERDYRTPFSGCMTRDTYTKAAHFYILREMLPAGHFRLITEQEATVPAILPHVFHEEISGDRFRWIAMTFDKEVKKPVMQGRVAEFRTSFEQFIKDLRAADPVAEASMTEGQRHRAFIAKKFETKVSRDRFGNVSPVQSSNYQQPFMPKIWVKSPIHTAGESGKIVGFPLMRASRRAELKGYRFDEEITDPDTRAAIAYHVWSATLQPVSTFFNSLRERVSFARRAGGRASRSENSYVNGSAFNPRVLIAVLNIFRVYYNWFEPRQYSAPWQKNGGTEDAPTGEILKRIPGTDQAIPMTKRDNKRPIERTPAMRHGIQPVRHDKSGRLIVPSLHRILYRPWLYWGTPVWDKFENPKVDRRTSRKRGAKVHPQQ